jgi:hypothetical protein
MDFHIVKMFLKKWWGESDFKAPNLPLSLRLKVSADTITVFITILEQNVMPYDLQLVHRSQWTKRAIPVYILL